MKRPKLPLFFALTFAISWALWLTVVFSGQYYLDFPAALLYLLGGFGPSAAGVILVLRTYNREARRDFFRRTFSFRSISPGWLLFIILVFPLVNLMVVGISLALGGPPPGGEQLSLILAQPVLIVPVLLTTLIAGPLSEELGWRGYALDGIQRRFGFFASNLVLAVIWWAWHLPLFSIVGTTQYQWGWFSASFWLYLVNIFPLAFLHAIVYNQNQRSILAAVLLHFFANLTFGMLYPLDAQANFISAVLLFAVAAWMSWRYRQALVRDTEGTNL
jgi:uncharacterized protein